MYVKILQCMNKRPKWIKIMKKRESKKLVTLSHKTPTVELALEFA